MSDEDMDFQAGSLEGEMKFAFYKPIFKVPGDAFKKDAKEDLRLQLDVAETEGCAFVVPAEHVAMLNELLFGKRIGQ